MGFTRARVAACALVAACAAGGTIAATAGGQAGPPAGTLEFDVVSENPNRTFGVNTVTGRPPGDRRGQQRYPRIGDVVASNARVRLNGQFVGRADFAGVVTDRGNGRGRGDVTQLATAVITIGNDRIVLSGALVGNNESEPVVASITGGTGPYVGAEGVVTSRVTQSSRNRQVEHFTLTFAP
jgi:hypothetical protein